MVTRSRSVRNVSAFIAVVEIFKTPAPAGGVLLAPYTGPRSAKRNRKLKCLTSVTRAPGVVVRKQRTNRTSVHDRHRASRLRC